MDTNVIEPPEGTETIGDAHGDIAVSPSGDIYVSVQGGDYKGVQVYDADGRYLRNLPDAPSDLHGFIIVSPDGGTPSIYGARRHGQEIVRLALDGRRLLTIPGTAIPEQYKKEDEGERKLHLTGVAVAPNGDIYAVDGYGLDFIHRFNSDGAYIDTFAGKGPPWNLNNCHKIAIDPRFQPARLLCTDRLNGRLVHMSLDGEMLGVVADDLRWPSAVAFYNDELALAEIQGRVSILGLQGEILGSFGTNENEDEILTNKVPPDKWRSDLFHSPHGIAYDACGNLLVVEWNEWGRVVRLNRPCQE
jgi:hypothetical protein